MLSFREMKDLLLPSIRSASTVTASEKRAGQWLNAIVYEWLSEAKHEIDSVTHQFTIAAATTEVTNIPMDVMSIVDLRILDKAGDTNYKATLDPKTPQEMDDEYPNRASENTGTPDVFTFKRIQYPAVTGDAVGLSVVSTSNTDLTATGVKCGLTGYTTTAKARLIQQEKTANGTTAVAYDTPCPLITQFSKSIASVGFIQLIVTATPATILAEIMPWERTALRPVIEVFPYVDAAYLMEIRYNRRNPPMANDSDGPYQIPPEFHIGIVEAALAKFAYAFIDDDRMAAAMQISEQMKTDFILSHRPLKKESGGFRWQGGRRGTLHAN